jgi:hypothetical protein
MAKKADSPPTLSEIRGEYKPSEYPALLERCRERFREYPDGFQKEMIREQIIFLERKIKNVKQKIQAQKI